MRRAVELAVEYTRSSIETALPFIVTVEVFSDRRYQLAGCSIPDGSIRVERVYFNEDDEQIELLGWVDEEQSIEDIESAIHALMHDDLKEYPLKGDDNA